MPKLALTEDKIERLQYDPTKGQEQYSDEDIPGFILILNKSCATFYAKGYVHGREVMTKIGRHKQQYTAKEARFEARKLLVDMAKGINPNEVKKEERRKAAVKAEEAKKEQAQAVTLRQALDALLSDRNLKSAGDYRYSTQRCFSDWLDKPIQSITKADIVARQKQVHEWIQQASKKKDAKRGYSFANGAFRVLRSVFNYAVVKFDLTGVENPVRVLSQLRLWHKDERRKRVIHRAYLAEWMTAVLALPDLCSVKLEPCSTIRWNAGYAELQRLRAEMVRDYLLLLLFTGLRKMEAASLTWDAIDLTAGTLTITKTKNTDTLVLPLPEYIASILRERREQHPKVIKQLLMLTHPSNLAHFKYQIHLGKFRPIEDYVFPWLSVPHRPVGPKSPGKFHAQAKTEWKLERVPYLSDASDYIERVTAHIEKTSGSKVEFSLHDLRRTFITFAESMDISMTTIKALVNHRYDNSDVTSGYVVLDVERLRKAMTGIEKGLLAAAGLAPSADIIDFDAHKQAHAAA